MLATHPRNGPGAAHFIYPTGTCKFEQTFRSINDILRREGGGALKYTEQSSWILFLKYLNTLELEKAIEAVLEGKEFTFILDEPYRWAHGAVPKDSEGKPGEPFQYEGVFCLGHECPGSFVSRIY